MTDKQYNHPNFFQCVTVYKPGSAEAIEHFEIGQVWDGSLVGYRRLRRQCLETVEGLRDRTGFEYILWTPTVHGGVTIPRLDKQSITVS